MQNRGVLLLTLLIALVAVVCITSSCGEQGRFVWGVEDDLWSNGIYLEDGDRRGNYIYYHGDWHYRGLGTPYYWEFY